MTTDANMDQPDVVIVGGGNSSADFIPDLCNALSNRVRGVVFIDHDIEEIRELKTKLQSAGIEMASITL